MADPIALAELHRVGQVQAAAQVQNALGHAFNRLDPMALDASFPAYLRASLAVLGAGRRRASGLAKVYYGQTRSAAGVESLIPTIHVPDLNVEAVTASLLINGPVSVKTQLANGTALQAAMNSAKGRTLAAGKRITLNASRDTLINAVQSDDAALGWARMSDGQPCHFCAMLVSRGPVYKAETVRFRAHDGCGCGARPFFDGDPHDGWSPDARALNDLWNDGGSKDWRNVYGEAVMDPSSPVFNAFAEKVGAQISAPLQKAAREAARTAYTEAQVLKAASQEAAANAAESAAARLAAEEAKAAAAEAAKKAATTKKWLGKPAPKKPSPPTPPGKVGPAAFDQWLAASKKRFSDFAATTGNPKNDLTKSLNWSHFEKVVNDHDLAALQYLKAQNYIDHALEAEALKAIQAAEVVLPGQDVVYKKALRSYKNQTTRHDRYIQEWRDVNGVTDNLAGMDDALRHTDDYSGIKWADKHLPVATGEPRSAVQRYTGHSYDSWNAALRTHADVNSLPAGTWKTATANADKAFKPLPEPAIVNRGTGWSEFDIGGKRLGSIPPPPPEDLIGTVHTQHGYMSTSVGKTAGGPGAGKPVQLKLRVPQDHGAAWAQPYSAFSSERELLLQRGTTFFVHDVYKDPGGYTWIVEAEVIPMDADVAAYAASAPNPSTVKFTGGW